MKINLKRLLLCILLPLAVGGLSAFLSRSGMSEFSLLNKPPLTPPAWVFPVVWSILYVLMGIASYLFLESDVTLCPKKGKGERPLPSCEAYTKEARSRAFTTYLIQLIFNFYWSIIFFSMKQYLFAFIWLILLLVLIALTMRRFFPFSPKATYLLIPYIVWVTLAGYLNLGVYLLNK